MRRKFQEVISESIRSDDNLVLLLGDIGVFGFSKVKEDFPERVINVGILEQTMISMAAGIAASGMNPIVHSIAPFLVERALEQIKIDFGYQKLHGNLFSVGGSIDYSTLGGTHHCPGDVSILLTIPGTEILIPGTSGELEIMINDHLKNKKLTYFRLSEKENTINLRYSKTGISEIKAGKGLSLICIGPFLDEVVEATQNLDVQVIYINKIDALKGKILRETCLNDKILLIEPFYEGTTSSLVMKNLNRQIYLQSIGVPREFIHRYGSQDEILKHIGLTSDKIESKCREMILM